MAQPQAYNRIVDFTDRDGDETNHAAINSELDAAALSINQTRDSLALIQRDDGALKNGVVTAESLSDSALSSVLGEVAGATAEASASADRATLFAAQAEADKAAAQSAASAAQASQAAAALSAASASNSQATASEAASSAGSDAAAAGSSAASSATSASTATNKAAEASTSAANASGSATSAQSSASAAANSAATAANSAATAANSAATAAIQASEATSASASAASLLDQFEDRYLGSKTTDPTTDNDGNALINGALYFNSVAGDLRVWTGTNFKSAGSAVAGTVNTAKYTAAAGQTSFSIVYDVGFVHVYLNGVKLEPGVEFAANNGTTVVLTTGAAAGDVVDMIAFGVFSVANTYTKAEIDSKLLARGLFSKSNPDAVAWTKTGTGTASTASTIYAEVNGAILLIASGTPIIMPGLDAGTDYAIWLLPSGSLQATSNHTSPPAANARKVGGFHYAPGGNAAGQSGGNTIPQINEFSFWDVKWRPSCPDPRGMTLVAGGFWSDIYLTGVDAITNGSSKFNVQRASGSYPPKRPVMFGGGNYAGYGWFDAMELATAFGKRCPTQQEFMALAYGTTESSSFGSGVPLTTALNQTYTSRWGVIQSTGISFVWGRDRGGSFAASSWTATAVTNGRGAEYGAPGVSLFGGSMSDGVSSGSRCSYWSQEQNFGNGVRGSRFVCDHMNLE